MNCIKHCFPKIKEYIKRFGLAELVSYSFAIIGGTLYFKQTGNYSTAAIIVVIGDNFGYYGTIFVQEVISGIYRGLSFTKSIIKSLMNMGFDFGIPQIVEVLIIYPLLLTYVPQLFVDYTIGIFVAMTIAVIIFYIQAIFLYELRKKYFKN